jgi:hypothetical protein
MIFLRDSKTYHNILQMPSSRKIGRTLGRGLRKVGSVGGGVLRAVGNMSSAVSPLAKSFNPDKAAALESASKNINMLANVASKFGKMGGSIEKLSS